MVKRGLIVLILFVFLASHRLFPGCLEHREMDNAGLIAFLTKDKARAIATNPDCVTYAISHLGDTKSIESTGILSDYLDYKRPLTGQEKEMIQMHLAIQANELYPAVLALLEIGKPSLPALIDKISRQDVSAIMLENAVRTTMFIFSGDPSEGIRFLKSSAEQSHDTRAAAQIRKSIEGALRWCGDTNGQEKCRAVLREGPAQQKQRDKR